MKTYYIISGLIFSTLVISNLQARAYGESGTPRQAVELRETLADAVNVEQVVRNIIVQQLKIEPERVTLAARFVEDLGINASDADTLISTFEKEFKLEISDAEAEKMLTVGDVVKFIKDKIATPK